MREKIKFNLLENAEESLSHAVDHLLNQEGDKAGNYKRVILDIAHVIELILKERIFRIHPAFIWQNIDKYPSPLAPTITTDIAVKRLLNLGGICLSEESQKTILACRKIRNSIEHYEFEIEEKEAKAIIGRLLSFIFYFVKQHLTLDWEKDFKTDDRWAELIEIYEFWEAYSQTLEKKLSEEGKPVYECPFCGACTFDLSIMQCELCGHIENEMECDFCHEQVWESETETYKEIDGDEDSHHTFLITICRKCIDAQLATEAAAEEAREYFDESDPY